MAQYVCKRILLAIPVLLGISVMAFVLGVLSPGDPAEFVLNQDGLQMPTEAQLACIRTELGLDKPFYVQYLLWISRILQGDFGTSYINGRDILQEILLRLPVTAKLAAAALVVAAGVGITTGILCAVFQDSWIDKAMQLLTNIMLSVPGFWLALLLILLFCEGWRLLPTSGSNSWVHFILPASTISFSTAATICRFMRSALLKEFGQQYFMVAKARGISSSKLLWSYALPNAVLPVFALLGNYFAGVLGGSIIVESIFALPGISSMALEAIRFRDYPVLQAYVLVTGCVLVVVTLTVDLLMFYINPKMKTGAEK